MPIKVPILAYHGANVFSNDYSGNDHVALEQDLRLISRLGLRVVPLHHIVDWVRRWPDGSEVTGVVGISFDDGTAFDWYDLEDPEHGKQRSMAGILRDFMHESGQPAPATSFVIACPEAREQLDKSCLHGLGWMGDEWWMDATREGLIEIGNHSWDHLHPDLARTAHSRNAKGSFRPVDNLEDARTQITGAGRHIERRSGIRPTLLGYPWGEAPDYLVQEYLPNFTHEHGLIAAFTTEPRHVTGEDDVWRLPRFVCGHHWSSPKDLELILMDR